jgi:NADPH2:quinone reductase
MNAIQIDRYGGPEELVWREVAPSRLGPSDVRIRTAYAAVNRADVEIRSGAWPVARPDPFPYTPGLEVAGEVEEVGSAVADVAPGSRVITMMQRLGGIWGERPGGYAELVDVAADAVATIPADVGLEQIAALGLAAVTASAAMRRLDPQEGERVVVHGASGGVGSAAVMMAADRGCEVVAVLPRAGKEEFVRTLGASQVVLLDETSLLDALGARSAGAVLETNGERTFSDSVAVLERGGRLCLVGALTGADLRLSAWDLIQELELSGWSSENLDGDELRSHVAEIAELVRAGRLGAQAIERYEMADAAAAHRAMERGELVGRALLVA